MKTRRTWLAALVLTLLSCPIYGLANTTLDQQRNSFTLPLASPSELRTRFEGLVAVITARNSTPIEQLIQPPSYEIDTRGRSFADDVNDFVFKLAASKYIEGVEAAFSAALGHGNVEEARRKFHELEFIDNAQKEALSSIRDYWTATRHLNYERMLWLHSLRNNHMPSNTEHRPDISALESHVKSFPAESCPTVELASLVQQLATQFAEERSALARTLGKRRKLSSVRYHQRRSPCPSEGDIADSTSIVMKGRPGSIRFAPDTASVYPAISKRNEEEGSVALSIRVSAEGCAIAAGILASSGSDELDMAALRYADTLQYFPDQQDGNPAETTHSLLVTFKLQPTAGNNAANLNQNSD